MKTKLLILAVLIFSILFYVYKTYNKPHINVKKEQPVIKISAKNLQQQYNFDEAKANSLYFNKIIEVFGKVKSTANQNGKEIITLKGEESDVICQLNDNYKEKINVNDSVSVKGICSGMLMDVMLVNCVINKHLN